MAKKSFDLTAALTNLESRLATVKEESTLRQYFLEALNKFLEANGLAFAVAGPLFALDQRLVTGKPDAAIGAILFEIKLPAPKGKGLPAAIKQAKGYISEAEARRPRGVAYDGHSLALLDENGAVSIQGSLTETVPTLESWLLLLAGKVTDVEQMVARLGSDSAAAQTAIRVFYRLFEQQRRRVAFVQEVFEVWQALYACAANLNTAAVKGIERAARYLDLPVRGKRQAEQFLFCLETYLAILLKLLVARVAVEQKLVPHRSVREVLFDPSGAVHRRYQNLEDQIPHLKNVFESDTFSWFTDAADADKETERLISNLLLALTDLIDNVNLTVLRQDFLQLFYQQFFDPAARRALGEFYTNRELVRETLDTVSYDGTDDGILVDISCGSGNFLVEAIARRLQNAKSRSKAALLRKITGEIFGADIHPLAVAMARVNYLIAVQSILTAGETITVPIYWADSLSRLASPHRSAGFDEFGVPVKIQIPGMKAFELPSPHQLSWDKVLEITRNLVHGRPGIIEPSTVWPRFVQEMGPEALRFEATLRRFLKQIVDLHNAGRDMRWLPLLRNVLRIESLRGQCKYVVGNPPWVRIHNIEEYFRRRVNEDFTYCALAGWERGCNLAGIARGFAQKTDLCVPFVERSLELLSPGGSLGFVITSKIQQALYANALRRDLVQNRTIRKIVDYSLLPVPLFLDAVNYPMILSVENAKPANGHKIAVVIHNLLRDKIATEISQEQLPAVLGDAESPWLMAPAEIIEIIRKMQAGRILGGTEQLRARMGVKAGSTSDYVLLSIEETDKRGELLATNEYGQRFRIEAEMVYPLIRGESLAPWHRELKQYMLFPHSTADGSCLPALPPQAAAYFADESRLDRLRSRQDYQDSEPAWTIFRVTADKLGPRVCWPEISQRMSASFVPQKVSDPLLGERHVIPLQTAYLIPTFSDQAGYLLAAALNSTCFRTQLMAFAERARGAYFRHFSWTVGLGFIPESFVNELHLNEENQNRDPALEKVLKRSEELHSGSTEDPAGTERELDSLLAPLFGIDDRELGALQAYRDFISPPRIAPVPIDGEDELEPSELEGLAR